MRDGNGFFLASKLRIWVAYGSNLRVVGCDLSLDSRYPVLCDFELHRYDTEAMIVIVSLHWELAKSV